MLLFLCNDLEKLLKLLLPRFITYDKFQGAKTITQLHAIDLYDSSNQVRYSQVDVGFAADRILRTLWQNKKLAICKHYNFEEIAKHFFSY